MSFRKVKMKCFSENLTLNLSSLPEIRNFKNYEAKTAKDAEIKFENTCVCCFCHIQFQSISMASIIVDGISMSINSTNFAFLEELELTSALILFFEAVIH